MLGGFGRRLYRAARRGDLAQLRLRPGHDVTVQPRPVVTDGEYRVLIAPANFAEQGWLWARALERLRPDIGAVSMCIGDNLFGFRSDYGVSRAEANSLLWGRNQLAWVRDNFSHVLVEAFSPVLGQSLAAPREWEKLQNLGLHVALVAHGSDVRIPSVHLTKYQTSPFGSIPPSEQYWVRKSEARTQHNVQAAIRSGLTMFVATPDLVDFLPGATWLPTCIDVDYWQATAKAATSEVPTVLYAPTKSWLKGGHTIEPELERLNRSGIIDYVKLEGVPQHQVRDRYRLADVVVDQIFVGMYGVTSIQALASGKVAIAGIADHVAQRLPMPYPGIVVSGPHDFAAGVEQALAALRVRDDRAQKSVDFVRTLHSGPASAAVLARWITDTR